MKRIAEQFRLDGAVQSVATLGEGFINDTYIVTTERARYVLQRKNRNVFTDIPAMMRNIEGVTSFLREKVRRAGGDPRREVMTVIPTHDGALYYEDAAGDYWAATLFIEDSVTCQSASTPELARCGGEGIGRFQRMLADYGEPLADILPGFHDIRSRFRQWDDALARDAAGRRASVAREIEWIECRRDEMLRFWQRVETGEIPRRVTHNDTKINNILFDKQGEVLCAIDLDTVMASTSLNDFGDAIRSYANTGDEDDRDLSRVGISLEMFSAYTDGYLSLRAAQLTDTEIGHLAFSARYITFEQVLRFLMDYIDGDTYYKIKYPDHNLVRTHAQYRLLQSMEEHYGEMCRIVDGIAAKYRNA